MNKRLTFKVLGSVLMVEGAMMGAALIVSLIYRGRDARALMLSMAITLAAGGALSLLKPRNDNLRAREGFAIVALSWISISLFGGLPFFLHGCIPSFLDCFFETVSGFTTTGATILTDIESLPRGLLFWRSFTHWAGGMGVLVLSLALIPKIGARSIFLMRAESPGPSTDKLVPRTGNYAKILYFIYIGLTGLMVVTLLLCGMNLYDALVHTFGAAGTGGFSTYNNSIAAFNSPVIEVVIGVYMALFGVNFAIYHYLFKRNFSAVWANSELKCYLALMLGATVVIALNILPRYGDFLTSLRYGFFQVSSVMTTTGYATADFDRWPALSRMLLMGIALIGASAGSTGGGIKVVRVQLLAKTIRREVRRTIHPKSVNPIMMDGRMVDESMLSSVLAFFFTYFFILCIAAVVISLDGFSFETNVTAVIATLSNIGPGLGMVGPVGNFSQFSALSKLVLSACMLIGRLEIFPILMLFAPGAWRRY